MGRQDILYKTSVLVVVPGALLHRLLLEHIGASLQVLLKVDIPGGILATLLRIEPNVRLLVRRTV